MPAYLLSFESRCQVLLLLPSLARECLNLQKRCSVSCGQAPLAAKGFRRSPSWAQGSLSCPLAFETPDQMALYAP